MGTDKTSGQSGRMRRSLGVAARRTGLARKGRKDNPAQRSRIRYPGTAQADQIQAGVEWAQLAMSESDWPQAIARWNQLLDRYGPPVSSRVYKGLATAYIELGQIGAAAAIVERGRALFPHAVDLPLVWAHIATVEEDWEEAIRRYRHVIETAGPTASWRPHKGIVAAYIKLGDLANAAAAADEGLRHFPDNVDVVGAWAGVPLEAEDWEEAIERWNHVVGSFGSAAPWRAYVSLAVSHAETGDLERAMDAVERGRSLHPGESTLASHAAEVAMALRDWTEAIDRWQIVLDLQIRARGMSERGELFPRRGVVWDWYEEAWQQITLEWDRIEPTLATKPTPLLFRSLALTMKNAGLPDEALTILECGARTHPDDSWLDFDLTVTRIENRNMNGRVTKARIMASATEQPGRSERFQSSVYRSRSLAADGTGTAPSDIADPSAATCARNAEVLAQFHPSLERTVEGLGPIHVIRVPAGSSVEIELKAGRYFSPSSIARRVAEVSHRDQWEEMTSSTNLLMARARATADALGSRFEEPPFLPADAYSDAALPLLFEELAVYEPMRRIAADIATENDDSAVFIESPTDSYRYLDSFPATRFDVIYLYFELRRRGVNAFICRILTSELPHNRPFRFVPGVRTLLPLMDANGSPPPKASQAVFPAGIRSVRRVGEAVGDVIVYTAGSVVKEFAYDRSLKQDFPIDPKANVHPPVSTLPELELGSVPVGVLTGVPLIPDVGLKIDARVEASEAIGHDWLHWMDHVLHGYYTEISMRSAAEIAARGITEAHVSDYLYPDATLSAYAVKRSGGRVVLWPHSANPAHISERRPGSFDEVHAVTRSGCELWEARFQDVPIHHTPSAMLDPAERDTTIDPNLPLSIVVIGGRTILRYMPELDQGLHESAYRSFFEGVADLKKRHPIDLYFKPRGLTGEHEFWLTKTVGGVGDWQRILEHPLRVDLPNPLFVSISMGTSALIEGLGRGIPGLIVRDFPLRDYTTLSEDALPIGTTSAMLGVIDSLFEPNGYERLLERELAYYATELQAIDPE